AEQVCDANNDFTERVTKLRGGNPQEALSLLDPATFERRRATLECGQTLANALSDTKIAEFVFKEDEKTESEITVLHLNIEDLPGKFGFVKHAFSGLPGFCFIPPKKAGSTSTAVEECNDKSYSAFHDGKTWIFGRKAAIETVSHGFTTPRKELTTSVEQLQIAADASQGLSVRRSEANPKSAASLMRLPCSLIGFKSAGGFKFLEQCFPSTLEKSLANVDGKVRAISFEVEGPFEITDGFHMNLIFVARDDAAGKEIETDLKDATRDWKSTLENNDAKLVKLVRDNPKHVEQKQVAAIIDTFLRAMKGMKVIRKGRVVSIEMDEKYSADEKKGLDEALGKSAEDKAAAVAITQAVLKGAPIPEASLATLIGKPWASFVLTPRATAADCTAIKDKLTTFESKPKDSIAIPFTLKAKLRVSCEGMPLTAAAKTCLTSAADGATFGKCTLPEEPKASDFGTEGVAAR
ncbi:MAG: hypothetical protein ABIP89_20900, partial [Polyangiaceae bacterium]